LTEIEALGLASQHDMANGHASHELAPTQKRIIDRLPELWRQGAHQKSRDAELRFKDAFRKLAESPSLTKYEHFKICPTASSSIDTVASWLAENKIKTALIEPTFDNLYLILKRRGVDLTPLPEESLHSGDFKVQFAHVDALFLVNPNNPTGRVLSRSQFTEIVSWCAEYGKILILDNTFRFFAPQTFDAYQILFDSQVTFLSIEDTGKVWPTQEIKASLIFCSSNVIKDISIIYDEIFLCHSNFALGILSEFLLDAHQRGLDEAVWKEVAWRRQLFRNAVEGTVLNVHADSVASTLSVEWISIQNHFKDDLALAEHFNSQNLVLLPGRQFYWSKRGEHAHTNSVRFALLKPKHEFLNAIDVLRSELKGVQK
jgi:aspartate/methionine/tyrosine aminotransferase